jgi:hypothetical protein
MIYPSGQRSVFHGWQTGHHSGAFHENRAQAHSGIYADRTAGGDRDCGHPCGTAAARRPKGREAANRTKCINNVKQLSLALHNYHDTHNVLPPGAIMSLFAGDVSPTGRASRDPREPFESNQQLGLHGSSWMFQILPYVEQANVHSLWRVDFNVFGNSEVAYDNSANLIWRQLGSAPAQVDVPGFYCPPDDQICR